MGCAVPRAVTGVTPLVPRTSSTLASIPLGLRMLLALASLYKVRSLLPFRGFGFWLDGKLEPGDAGEPTMDRSGSSIS